MGTVYFAKWILLESGEILENGALFVVGNTIEFVGPRSKARRSSTDRVVNLGDSLVLPGLINMHTHLEEGVVRGIQKDPEETFAAWSAKRHARVRQATPDTISSSIRLGIREHLAQGITTVVDSSRLGFSREVLEKESIRSWIIEELHPEDLTSECNALQTILNQDLHENGRIGSGMGPHAIFSLSPESHQLLINHTKCKDMIWASHLAESAEELQAFSERRGDLYFQITRKRNWLYGETTMGSMNYALGADLIPEEGICFHCNYVNGAELDYLASKKVHIVLCHIYTQLLGHKAFPLDAALNRKMQICLGTEGISSPGFMSLFEELFSLRNAYSHIPASEMLRWVTINPARALKMEKQLGSISPGKIADIIAVRFAHDPGEELLEELLLEEPEIAMVVIDGEEVVVNY